MNKRGEKKYLLTKRLYEIELELMDKYGILENMVEELTVYSGPQGSAITYPLTEYNKKWGTKRIRYNFIVNDFETENLDMGDVNLALFYLICEKNDAISPVTEEFWDRIEKEGLKIKRKNNRLLNILKKGYLGTLEDKEIFYRGIGRLIESDIFKELYGEKVKSQIIGLIDSQTERHIDNATRIAKKIKPSIDDMIKLDRIVTDFECYGEVLKINHDVLAYFKKELQRMNILHNW